MEDGSWRHLYGFNEVLMMDVISSLIAKWMQMEKWKKDDWQNCPDYILRAPTPIQDPTLIRDLIPIRAAAKVKLVSMPPPS